MQEVTRTSYNKPENDILLAPHLAFTINVQVGNTGVSTVGGRKIIPAGTPIGGPVSALETRDTVLKVATGGSAGGSGVAGAQAQGVLRHDVDVTNGNANAEMVVTGVVDTSKCPDTLETNAKTALKNIVFVNGGRA